MSGERPLLGKSPATYIAGEWFLTSVYAIVSSQLRTRRECMVTLVANVIFPLSIVHHCFGGR